MQYESERYQEIVESLIDRLWDYSELAFEEHRSVQALTEVLRDHGYKTELGVGGFQQRFGRCTAMESLSSACWRNMTPWTA